MVRRPALRTRRGAGELQNVVQAAFCSHTVVYELLEALKLFIGVGVSVEEEGRLT
jgi:hypothetical protein